MTKRVEELVEAVCGAGDHPLAPILRAWCGQSRAFLNFAATHSAKIRKKVRLASSEDERADLLAELGLAALLLRDSRFELVYEPHMAGGGRGPDFLARFRTHPAYHAEVTRLRPGETDLALKLARVLADKVGQLRTGGANLLAVVLPDGAAGETLIPDALRLLDRASQPTRDRSPGLHPGDVRGYFRQRERLSALLLLAFAPGALAPRCSLWPSPFARHPLAAEVVRALTPGAEERLR